jgi:hypothetical protein
VARTRNKIIWSVLTLASILIIKDCKPGSLEWLHEKRHEHQEARLRIHSLMSYYADIAVFFSFWLLVMREIFGAPQFVDWAEILLAPVAMSWLILEIDAWDYAVRVLYGGWFEFIKQRLFK